MNSLQSYDAEQEKRTIGVLTSVFKGARPGGRFLLLWNPTYNNPSSSASGPFGISKFEDDSAIFVVGMPRSGSTLVEQILSSHSCCWGAGESRAHLGAGDV